MSAYCMFDLSVYYLFLQYFDTVVGLGWVFWSVKSVSHITYAVLAVTLNYAQSINLLHFFCFVFCNPSKQVCEVTKASNETLDFDQW